MDAKNYFLGIELGTNPYIDRLYPLIQAAQISFGDHFNWVPLNNFHITFKYLGEIPDFTQIGKVIELITKNQPSFPVRFRGLEANFGANHNIAAITLDTSPLRELSLLLENLLTEPKNSHEFNPHVTIAKSKQKITEAEKEILLKLYESFPSGEIIVDKFSLMHRVDRAYQIDAEFELVESGNNLLI